MAAAAGLFSHNPATQALTGRALPMDDSGSSTSGSNSSSSDDGATISANDFLTLLVTEMQNQDPTADTDPNEYINQLVNVNSLEQLISINQTLTTDLGAPPASSDSASSTPDTQGAAANSKAAAEPVNPAAAITAHLESASQSSPANPDSALHAPGNLGVPAANAAAQRVGHALDGRAHAPTIKSASETRLSTP